MSIKNGYCFCANEWFLDARIRSELPLLLLISSLSAETGVCFAGNDYITQTLELDERSVSRKLKKLTDLGYITVTYLKRGAEVLRREIRPTKLCTQSTEMSSDDGQKCPSTTDKNVQDNNTSIKNIKNKPDGLFTRDKHAETKSPYGEFGKVMLTDEEYERALAKYDGDTDKFEFAINVLDTYLAQDKKRERRYTSHYAVLAPKSSWVRREVDERYVPRRYVEKDFDDRVIKVF